ncbi:MFS transporter [Nibricoccus aquaticus]|uniref:MFS transporter n=1 Tax=Nibricoccus aquaticus TaxID=2576891 RepID=A0A290QAZ3_9BACT|nr:MFS transporter [Nibricoccus aquaticus]ATC65417.1 MFS transporter [Nibricoccus aquaticus]
MAIASPVASIPFAASRPAHPQAWSALTLLWFAFFLNQADRQILPGVLPLVKAEFGLDSGQLGLLNSVFHWVYAALVPIAGWLADRRSRRRVIIVALVAWSVTTGLSGIAGSFLFLVLMRAATGAGEACYFPAAASLLTDLHAPKRTGLVLSIHQSANYVGVAGAGWLAGWVGETYGWHQAFYGFGAAGVFVAALLAWRLPDAPRSGGVAESAIPLRERVCAVLRVPSFYWLMSAFLGMLLVNTAYLAWMPTLLHERFGLTLSAAGFHAAIYHQAGALIGVLLGGKLSDAWLNRTILGRPLTQIVGLVLGIPFIALLGLSGDKIVVYGALGLFGICRGLFDSALFTSLFAVMPTRVRGLATGLMISLAFLGGGFAPWLVGLLAKSQGLGAALAWSASGYALGAVCLVLACCLSYRKDAERAQIA